MEHLPCGARKCCQSVRNLAPDVSQLESSRATQAPAGRSFRREGALRYRGRCSPPWHLGPGSSIRTTTARRSRGSCSGGDSSSYVGAGRGEQDRPQPAGECDAGGGGITPEGDPKVALRQQQALELLAPLLEKAMRPLLEEQTDLLDELLRLQGQQHEDGLQRCLNLIIELFEQQEEQQGAAQQLQLAASQRQEDLLRQILDSLAAVKDAHGMASGGVGASACQVPPEGAAPQTPVSAAEAPMSGGPSPAPGQGAAGPAARQQELRGEPLSQQPQLQMQPPPQQQQPDAKKVPARRPGAVGLLDYVRVTASDNPSMPPGTLGVVLGSDVTDGRRLKVWAVDASWEHGTFSPDELAIVERANVPSYYGRVQYLPYDPERRGVPVTRFTAAPGMLVRRGYDVREGEEREAAAGEIGVICPSHDLGDTCDVEWPHGYRKKYDTGRASRFELVHLEVSPTSGAPVVAGDCWASAGSSYEQQRGAAGEVMQRPPHLCAVKPTDGLTAVERGTHWVYVGAGEATAGQMGTSDCKLLQAKPGWVGVQLPDWTTVRRRASPVDGYDLCYSARDMDLVTLFTARQGLLARMDYYWQPVELVRPLEVRGDGVVWQVSLSLVDKHEDDKVLVGATQCDPVMWVIN